MKLCIWALCGSLYFVLPVVAAEPTKLAVLEVDSPQLAKTGDLLEAELLKLPEIEALDRANLNQVLQERKLQTVLSADATSERLKLAKLLKADVLVLLRAHEKPKPHVEFTVFESKFGLRLRTELVIFEKDPVKAAEALAPLIKESLLRARTPVTEIVAVPRLVNQSLTHEQDYLGDTIARLIQRDLLVKPGVAVIELEEARALARETELSGVGTQRRALPLFLLGEYRLTPNQQDRKASYELKVMRGDKPLQTISGKDLPPAELIARIRTEVGGIFEKALGKSPSQASDPKLESKQLVERAKTSSILSDHETALSLLEAALLVLPDQAEVHRLANEEIGLIARTKCALDRFPADAWGAAVNRELFDKTIMKMRLTLHGLRHVEAFWQLKKVPIYTGNQGEPVPTVSPVVWFEMRHPELDPLMQEYQDQVRALARRILDQRQAEKVQDMAFFVLGRELLPKPGRDDKLSGWAESHFAETLAAREKLLRDFSWCKAPWFHWNEWTHCSGIYQYDDPKLEPEFLVYLDRVEKLGIANIERSSKQARQRFKEEQAAYLKRKKSQGAPPVVASTKTRPSGETDVLRRELNLTVNMNGRSVPFEKIVGPGFRLITDQQTYKSWFSVLPNRWFNVSKGLDFLTFGNRTFVMREAGILTPVRLPPYEELETNVDADRVQFCSDGRYVWFASPNEKKPFLAVYDPASGQTLKLDAAGGLPPMKMVELKPLAPGKIAVYGYFSRTWLGTASLEGKSEIKLDVFFEANKIPKIDAKPAEFEPLDVAFSVRGGMNLISGRPTPDKPAEQRLVLFRDRARSLLIVDPERRKVETVPCTFGLEHAVVEKDGVLYYSIARGHLGPDKMDFCRVSFPELKPEKIEVKLPFGVVYEHQGMSILHLRRQQRMTETATPFYVTTKFPLEFRPLREENLNEIRQPEVFPSSFYGPVIAWDEKLYRWEAPGK